MSDNRARARRLARARAAEVRDAIAAGRMTAVYYVGSIELGRMFIGYKVKDAVDQIRSLVK